jgi:hypothetical protein
VTATVLLTAPFPASAQTRNEDGLASFKGLTITASFFVPIAELTFYLDPPRVGDTDHRTRSRSTIAAPCCTGSALHVRGAFACRTEGKAVLVGGMVAWIAVAMVPTWRAPGLGRTGGSAIGLSATDAWLIHSRCR